MVPKKKPFCAQPEGSGVLTLCKGFEGARGDHFDTAQSKAKQLKGIKLREPW